MRGAHTSFAGLGLHWHLLLPIRSILNPFPLYYNYHSETVASLGPVDWVEMSKENNINETVNIFYFVVHIDNILVPKSVERFSKRPTWFSSSLKRSIFKKTIIAHSLHNTTGSVSHYNILSRRPRAQCKQVSKSDYYQQNIKNILNNLRTHPVDFWKIY